MFFYHYTYILFLLDTCSILLGCWVYYYKYLRMGYAFLDTHFFKWIPVDCDLLTKLGSIRLENTGNRREELEIHVCYIYLIRGYQLKIIFLCSNYCILYKDHRLNIFILGYVEIGQHGDTLRNIFRSSWSKQLICPQIENI